MPIDFDQAATWLRLQMGSLTGEDVLGRLVWSLLILVSVLILRRLVLRYIDLRLKLGSSARYRWRKVSGWGTVALLLALIGPLWLDGAGQMLTYLGLLSAGIAVALRDPIANLFGWLFIIVRSPFELGDRIEIDSVKGDVIDQRVFEFTVMEVGNWVDSEQSTGRLVHIPNAKVFQSALANYSQGSDFLWHEVEVIVTFESNWQKAKDLLQDIADRMAKHLAPLAESQMRQASSRFFLAVGTLTPEVYTRLRGEGVGLTVRFLTPVRRRRTGEEELVEAMLEAFEDEPDIQLAYPTQRVVLRSGPVGDEREEPGLGSEPKRDETSSSQGTEIDAREEP